MSPKRIDKKRKLDIKGIKSLVSKNFQLKKIKLDPTNFIEDTKDKIGNFYVNLKKEREKEKIRLEKKRKLDEKRELQKEKNKLKRID